MKQYEKKPEKVQIYSNYWKSCFKETLKSKKSPSLTKFYSEVLVLSTSKSSIVDPLRASPHAYQINANVTTCPLLCVLEILSTKTLKGLCESVQNVLQQEIVHPKHLYTL